MITPIFTIRLIFLVSNDDYLRKVAKQGAKKAHESAAKTVREVREIIGLKSL